MRPPPYRSTPSIFIPPCPAVLSGTDRNTMSIRRPFNLMQWITDNRDLLKPPVGNKNLYVDAGDFIVMVVGGPNARKDYHWNETEELFLQLEGDIEVGVQEDGKAVVIPIKKGEMFLLPARTPHSPNRPANSVGLVVEAKRADREMKDGLLTRLRAYEPYGPGAPIMTMVKLQNWWFGLKRRRMAAKQ